MESLTVDEYGITDDETPFTYVEGTGKGPKKWGQIDPHWQVCDKGKLQSPIDLLDQRVQVFPNLGKLKRDYKQAPATIKNRGHDITVSYSYRSSYMLQMQILNEKATVKSMYLFYSS